MDVDLHSGTGAARFHGAGEVLERSVRYLLTTRTTRGPSFSTVGEGELLLQEPLPVACYNETTWRQGRFELTLDDGQVIEGCVHFATPGEPLKILGWKPKVP